MLDDAKIPLDNTRAERALRKIVVGRKAWMFYGSDTHAEAVAALFSLIASCRLHQLEPFAYLDEVRRVLPCWPDDRYLELAPKHWRATRQAEPAGDRNADLRVRDPAARQFRQRHAYGVVPIGRADSAPTLHVGSAQRLHRAAASRSQRERSAMPG